MLERKIPLSLYNCISSVKSMYNYVQVSAEESDRYSSYTAKSDFVLQELLLLVPLVTLNFLERLYNFIYESKSVN